MHVESWGSVWVPVVLAAAIAGCSPAARENAARATAPTVLVANTGDQTISRLDPSSLRVVGPRIAVGAPPWRVLSDGNDRLLVQLTNPHTSSGLVYLAPRPPAQHNPAVGMRGDYTATPIDLGADSRAELIAGDGGRYAAVIYASSTWPPAFPCGLAILDLRDGAVVGTHHLCGDGDVVQGLALATDAGGPVVYVALWDMSASSGGEGRIVMLDGLTGAPLASLRLSMIPGSLAVAPAQGDRPGRIFAATSSVDQTRDACRVESVAYCYGVAGRWQLLVLDSARLEQIQAIPLGFAPSYLQPTPGGTAVLAIDGAAGRTHVTVSRISLHSGHVTELAAVSFAPAALATIGRQVYVPSMTDNEVLVLDYRSGHRVRSIRVGANPLGVAVAGLQPFS